MRFKNKQYGIPVAIRGEGILMGGSSRGTGTSPKKMMMKRTKYDS
jgi:hypothetical protein